MWPTLPPSPREWEGRRGTMSGKIRREFADEDFFFELDFEEK